MTSYNELLNVLASQISSASGSGEGIISASSNQEAKENSTMLNTIGLEVQRQGGY